MSETITAEVSTRICKHMNKDHAEAVLLYAHAYGGSPSAIEAKMTSIDPKGMNMEVQENNQTIMVRIQFDHTLESAEDAHQTLVAMVKQAKATDS